MSATPSPTHTERADELILPLTDPADLFNAPPVNPLAGSPVNALGISGVEYLLGLRQGSRTRRIPHLVIQLPAATAATTSAERIATALHHHVACRIERERAELRDTYRYGWKIAGLAIVMLGLCLTLVELLASDLAAGMRPLTRRTFESGFEILGWVLLWHPIDVLAFTPLEIRARIARLASLAAMTVTVRGSGMSDDLRRAGAILSRDAWPRPSSDA
jgi:hypothetical protein